MQPKTAYGDEFDAYLDGNNEDLEEVLRVTSSRNAGSR